jgi:hypothetical protein
MLLTKHRAAAIHLTISAVVVGSVLTLMLLRWYPGAWFASMGGNTLIFILASVDIIIGPLLTWLVFQPGKSTLKFDLGVIVTLQIAAFLYGLHVLYEARPAYMILLTDQFRAVTAAELDPVLLAQARYPEFRQIPANGPSVATAQTPTATSDRDIAMMAIMLGTDLHQLPQFWHPYDGNAALRVSGSMRTLREIDPANDVVLDAFLQSSDVGADQLRFIPLRTRHKEMAALIDASTGKVVGVVDAKPWR